MKRSIFCISVMALTLLASIAAMAQVGTVAGTITDQLTSQPVQGATVTIAGIAFTTASDGTYFAPNIPQGEQSFVVTKVNYQTYTSTVEVIANNSVPKSASISPRTAVTGLVIDDVSEQPISGVTVSLGTFTATTGTDGVYWLVDVPTGTQSVTVSKTGYATEVNSVDVVANQTVNSNEDLVPATTVVMDTYTRANTNTIGATEDPGLFAYYKAWNNSASAIDTNQLYLKDNAVVGANVGVVINRFYPADFDFSAWVSCDSLTLDGYAAVSYRALGFGAEEYNNGYSVRLVSTAATGPIVMKLMGHGQELASVNAPTGTTFNGAILRIVATGNKHEIYFDGTKYIDYTDNSPKARNAGGAINLTRYNIWARFDDLNITANNCPGPSLLTGYVKSGSTLLTSAEVLVNKCGYSRANATTAEFARNGVIPGKRKFMAVYPGYIPLPAVIDMPAGNTVDYDFDMEPLRTGDIADVFNRANSATIGTTEDSVHHAWAKYPATDAQVKIVGSAAQLNTNQTDAGIYISDYQPSDIHLEIDMFQLYCSQDWTGISYRAAEGGRANPTEGYVVKVSQNGTLKLTRKGVDLATADISSINTALPCRIKVRAIGASHRIWFDDELLIDVVDTNSPYNGTGYVGAVKGGTGRAQFDNFYLPATVTAAKVIDLKQYKSGPVSLSEAYVSRVNADRGFFYVQDKDFTSGIKVYCTAAASKNTKVTLSGEVTEKDGEKCIVSAASEVTQLASGPETVVDPIGVNNRDFMTDTGLKNTGLLTTIWGEVMSVDTVAKTFMINDGGTAAYKMVAYTSSVAAPLVGDKISVRGPAGIWTDGTTPVLWLCENGDKVAM